MVKGRKSFQMEISIRGSTRTIDLMGLELITGKLEKLLTKVVLKTG